jgi:CBS domain-containing protein
VIVKVRDVMSPKVVICQVDDPLSKTFRRLREDGISGMPVMDCEEVVGTISESDRLKILAEDEEEQGQFWLPNPLEIIEVPIRELMFRERRFSRARDISTMNVSDVMRMNIHLIPPEEYIEEAAGTMPRHKINRLPVEENGKLIGIVTKGDIISGLGGGS